MILAVLANLIALAVMPFVVAGTINRVKSLWSGRRGQPILQLAFDVLRLARKSPVYSTTTTPVFRIAPYVLLATAVVTAGLVPLLGTRPVAAFPFDFVWFAYVWALGRVAIVLAALDTGSAFEGMGAAREAMFSSILEPALFLTMGALSFASGETSLHQILLLHAAPGAQAVIWAASVAALVIVLQVEAARMPVDDPTTHLELTMVHEVMVLDHSGPDLAAIQLGSAIKLYVGAAIVATLLNPWAGEWSLRGAGTNLAFTVLVAIALGTVESLVARLRMRAVPGYVLVALVAGIVAVLATLWRAEGPA